MFMALFPDGGGFTVAMVFRTAELARAEVEQHLRADAAAVGLALGELAVKPVWNTAMPRP